MCCYCMDREKLVAATVADHIKPHNGDPELFEGDLQSLCTPCHSKVKQIEESRGFRIGCDTDGRPIDPNHPWNREK